MKLFIYDHCPYCVKARMVFGLKGLSLKTVTLLNDDEKSPISMVGQKIVPILEKAPGQFMAESMDIVQFIDNHHPPQKIVPKEDSDLLNLLSTGIKAYYSLTMPRWVKSQMEEFKTPKAKKYFQIKKENTVGPFNIALKNTETFKLEILNVLKKVESQFLSLNSHRSASNNSLWWTGDGKISHTDFHLFAFLRGLSIVKDLKFPSALENYAHGVAKKSRVPLNFDQAI